MRKTNLVVLKKKLVGYSFYYIKVCGFEYIESLKKKRVVKKLNVVI
jgi:hypothetical protein